MKEVALYILGLCPLAVPGNPALSVELCIMSYEAQQRVIIPDNPLPEMPGLYEDVRAVCWPKSAC